jgi:hypothetical protein
VLLLPSTALACSLPTRESFPEALPEAKHVFVFQVVSAAVSPAADSTQVVAKVRIVETLKGAPRFTHLVYSNRWCGGNRLDVGHLFLVATSQHGAHLNLGTADRTVLDITRGYYEGNPAATHRAGLIPAVVGALQGKALPSYFLDRSLEEDTQTFTVPPPPPPTGRPCRKRGGV